MKKFWGILFIIWMLYGVIDIITTSFFDVLDEKMPWLLILTLIWVFVSFLWIKLKEKKRVSQFLSALSQKYNAFIRHGG